MGSMEKQIWNLKKGKPKYLRGRHILKVLKESAAMGALGIIDEV
jgi:hypothetical protein